MVHTLFKNQLSYFKNYEGILVTRYALNRRKSGVKKQKYSSVKQITSKMTAQRL